jgi:hypothetical protein
VACAVLTKLPGGAGIAAVEAGAEVKNPGVHGVARMAALPETKKPAGAGLGAMDPGVLVKKPGVQEVWLVAPPRET